MKKCEGKLFHDEVIELFDQSKSYMNLTDDSTSVSLMGLFDQCATSELE